MEICGEHDREIVFVTQARKDCPACEEKEEAADTIAELEEKIRQLEDELEAQQ